MNTPSPLNELASQHFDVVLIGGGINGAAGAQQLAAQGYKVLLVDKNDFGSGSSSRSSRLLHCGLRYLAPGSSMFEFVRHPSRLKNGLRMAKLAIDARHDFSHTTPKRTELARLHFPIYRTGAYKGWQVDLAFKVLEQFNKGKVPLNYERLSKIEALKNPLVAALKNTGDLDSVAVYDEFQMSWPERVTADCIQDAVRCGATALNYTAARLGEKNQQGWEVVLDDQHSGESYSINAKIVIATAGIWIDKLLSQHREGKPPKVFGTKGAHIVLELPEEYKGNGIATINSKMEPFYCLPWGKYHYIGPTEEHYIGDLNKITTTTADRDWLLNEAQQVFPGLHIRQEDIKYTWSGVRPLTWDAAIPSGNRARVLHDLTHEGLHNVFAMTAGPVMTHRSAGHEITVAVSKQLAPSGERHTLNYDSEFPDPRDPLVLQALSGKIEEPDWMHNMLSTDSIVHLSDLIVRRSGLVWYSQLSDQDLTVIGTHIGKRLGWSPTRIHAEIKQVKEELETLQGCA